MASKFVAVCVDDPPPAANSDFSTCTAVVWVEDSSAWNLPDFTLTEWSEITGALILLFATLFVGRLLIKAAT